MQPQTIKESAPETVEAIKAIERQADDCYKSLELLTVPGNLAIWGALTEGIRLIEQAMAAHGDNSSGLDASLINLGRSLTTAIKWILAHGKAPSKLAAFRWTPDFARRAEQTVQAALQYASFETAFPMWHKDRYAAQLKSPRVVRFSSLGSTRERQVSAYQKGFRPTSGEFEGKRAQRTDMSPKAKRLFDATLDSAVREGHDRFRYTDPWDLWEELLPEYQARVSGIARRSDSLSPGSYTLGEFNRFYAAVLAVGAAHEHLCWSWGQRQSEFPIKSAVLIWNRPRWTSVFSGLSGIAEEKCRAMLSDLCFMPEHSVDLHVHPFGPLDKARFQIALAAPFPLHGLPDENILLVCSLLRPEVFAAASLETYFSAPNPGCPMLKEIPPAREVQTAFKGPRMPAPDPNLDHLLRTAIEQTRLLRLRYRNKDRIVEPHDYGEHNGTVKLLTYQVGGSSTGPLPDWRWMETNLISDAELLDQTFAGGRPTASGKHHKWDKLFLRVKPADKK